ncbi:MAG TPA: 3-hexulose-6-phosphate synthase [Ktedonobacteraceae bacterium]
MRAQLQLAIDTLTPREALTLIEQVSASIDLIEAGTPFLKRFGLGVLAQFHQVAPEKLLVADMKCMDAGAYEAAIAFDAGADIVTILGCAPDETLLAALKEARRRQRHILVDLIAVAHPIQRAQQLERLGIDYIGVHTGLDQQAQGQTPLAMLKEIRAAVQTPVAVAGGINGESINAIAALDPTLIIVGSHITQASDPVAVSLALRKSLDRQQQRVQPVG